MKRPVADGAARCYGGQAEGGRGLTTRGIYTHGHHESVLRSHRWRTAENSAAYLLPHLAPGMRLLDVGCGPGTITADLAARVAPGTVTALEVEPPTRWSSPGPRPRPAAWPTSTFAVGDVHALDFPDDAFDVVHAHQVLQHLADPVRALREMRRVVPARRRGRGPRRRLRRLHLVPGAPRAGRVAGRSTRGWPAATAASRTPGRRLLSWARAAGFPEITPTVDAWCFATPEDRAWWGGLWADRIRESAFARHARAHGATDADLERMAAAWREWAAAEDGWMIVPHGELICRA